MHYVTHQFASLETLDRARRWLVQLGFGPDQVESHTDGVPRLAVRVRPEQADEVRQLINAAERTDPQGWPSFWDVAHQTHVYPCAPEQTPPQVIHQAHTTVGWHPQDAGAQVHETETVIVAEGRDVT